MKFFDVGVIVCLVIIGLGAVLGAINHFREAKEQDSQRQEKKESTPKNSKKKGEKK